MKTLETDRLRLRDWQLTDVVDMYEYAKDERVGPNAGSPVHPSEEVSQEIIESFIEDQTVFAIELKSEKKVIGSIGIDHRKPFKEWIHLNQREMGYVLNPTYWGHGLMPEAAKRVIEHAFEELDLDVLWCGHYSDNHHSKRVIDKCGFDLIGRKKGVQALL